MVVLRKQLAVAAMQLLTDRFVTGVVLLTATKFSLMGRRRKPVACLRISAHPSTLPKRLMILRIPSQKTGLTLPSKPSHKPAAHVTSVISCPDPYCLCTY